MTLYLPNNESEFEQENHEHMKKLSVRELIVINELEGAKVGDFKRFPLKMQSFVSLYPNSKTSGPCVGFVDERGFTMTVNFE